MERHRSYRYPPSPDPNKLAAIDFQNTMFEDFHIFTKVSANGEVVIFLGSKNALRHIYNAEGIISDGTFQASGPFGQLFIMHATVGPKLQGKFDDLSYENQQRKNFTCPVGYAFMSHRTTSCYELLWNCLRDEINDSLGVDWKGPTWILEDFERAQKKAIENVSF